MRELKQVYGAATKELAKLELQKLSDKWESNYLVVL